MPTTQTEKKISQVKEQRRILRINATKQVTLVGQRFVTVDGSNLSEAQALVLKLHRIKAELNDKDEVIQLNLASDDDVDQDIGKSMEYSESLSDACSELQSRINTHKSVQTPVGTHSLINPSQSDDSTAAPLPRQRLPQLELTKFDGNPLKWEEFWDDFTSSVDSRSDIPVIDKFKLLKLSLLGDALRVADGYLLTIANYQQVKDDLGERYGDPEAAIFAHLEALLAISPANHDLSKLQQVRDACETHIRSLVALGLAESTFGQVFVPIILSKLPKFVKTELYRKNGSQKWTIASLRTLLKEEIRARDKGERSSITKVHDEPQHSKQTYATKGFGKDKGHTSTATSLLSPAQKGNARGKGKRDVCKFCSKPHLSWQCRTYATVEDRKAYMKGNCFVCFSDAHSTSKCPDRTACEFCQKNNHHCSLCYYKFGNQYRDQANSKSESTVQLATQLNVQADEFQPNTPVDTVNMVGGLRKRDAGFAVMQTAVATIKGSTGNCLARFIFDSASSISCILNQKAKQIGAVPVDQGYTSVGRFMSKGRYPLKYTVYELKVQTTANHMKTLQLKGVDHISEPIQLVPLNSSRFPFLGSLNLAEPLVKGAQSAPLDILIGLDYYHEFLDGKMVGNPGDGVVFLSSILGYVASGYLRDSRITVPSVDTQMLILDHGPQPDNKFELERFWRLEDIGISDDPGSNDDERAMEFFTKTVKQVDGRYFVKWPFKSEVPALPDNYALAQGRFRSLLKRIQGNADVMDLYAKTITDQVEKGIIEEAPAHPDGLVHYIPHHCVLTPSKTTTKLRIVYDGSAKAGKFSPSLNDSLLRGPVILSNLCGLLLRFRLGSIAMTSDVAKAFHQVGLQTEDRDVTRFFWLKDVNKPPAPDNIIVFRFARVPFGTNASSFLLAATIVVHMNSSPCPTAKEILDNHYVDNVLSNKANVSDAISYYREAKALFNGASMNLREWYSNSPTLMQNIAVEDRGTGDHTSVLGLKWDLTKDKLHCTVGKAAFDDGSTKRHVLRSLASVFDPCGWFSPITVRCKILMQMIWIQKIPWDDQLPNDIVSDWTRLRSDLRRIPDYPVDRYDPKGSLTGSNLQLHCFCDASAKAYAAVIYLRSSSATGTTSKMIMTKTRIAPIKGLSIPRMELMAALIGIRLILFVCCEMKLAFSRCILWTDAKCVLHWLARSEVTTVFVKNRLTEIQNTARQTNTTFRHVPGDQNPADIPSRGTDLENLVSSRIWWHGPDWLTSAESTWPGSPALSFSEKDGSADDDGAAIVALADSQRHKPARVSNDPIFDLCRYSNLSRLLRVTCWIMRFVNNLKGVPKYTGGITAVEIDDVQRWWEKRVQRSCFGEYLDGKKTVSMRLLDRQLGLYIDASGVIRCRGRYRNATIPELTKYPKLMPKASPFTVLLIKHHHSKLMHAGLKHTLSAVRSQFWIPHGRSQVKRVISQCSLCRRLSGGPFRVPDSPPLPEFRVGMQQPFSCVGIDYLGPLHVRTADGSSKVWICLFTCAVTRAIYLEVVGNLTSEDFLLCLRRFVANNVCPKVIVSDNAKHFRLADQVITKLWHDVVVSNDVQSFASQNRITWKFIPEHAPWMGGFYERLVSPVKFSLKRALGKKCVKIEELQTLCHEIASILNSRPLLYDEANVGEQALTPAHLLLRSKDQFPAVSTSEPEFTADGVTLAQKLVQGWKSSQRILNAFWDVWRDHYLLSLREASKAKSQRATSELKPEVGTVVQVKDPLPRCSWRLGRIVKKIQSSDGACRSVELRLPNGKTLVRPIKLLYPLEASFCDDVQSTTVPSPPAQVHTVPRRRRAAAIAAGDRIRQHIESEESDE